MCDLAEYYHIYDWRAFKPSYIATLVMGLPMESRTALKVSGQKVPAPFLLQAAMCDRLTLLCYQNTKDGQTGKHRPKMIVDELISERDEKKPELYQGFESIAAFEAARDRIIHAGGEET